MKPILGSGGGVLHDVQGVAQLLEETMRTRGVEMEVDSSMTRSEKREDSNTLKFLDNIGPGHKQSAPGASRLGRSL